MKTFLWILVTASIILHGRLVTPWSYYKQTFGKDLNEFSLKEEFFQCDSEPLCTHVVKMKCGKYKTVRGEEELKILTEIAYIWKRVQSTQGPISGNVARGKSTRQSSTGWYGVSSRAVDGDKNNEYDGNSCTHTHKDSKPWWRVDLGAALTVKRVVITNRLHHELRLRQVQITVGNVDGEPDSNLLCAYFPGAVGDGETKAFDCSSPIKGRYVFVALRVKEYLSLCEVEVYVI